MAITNLDDNSNVFQGSPDDDEIYGNKGDDTLSGMNGNDRIYGGEDNDILYGNDGDDTLIGGVGNDAMHGGTGNDLYYVDSLLDAVNESDNQGWDTVKSSITYTMAANIEELELLGIVAINGIGNELNNRIHGNGVINILYGNDGDDDIYSNDGNDILYGDAGDDHLDGGRGNDTLWGDTGNDNLIGGAGADIMRGGANDDNYTVDNSADQVIESLNEGWDNVNSTATFTLGSNIENLRLEGFAAINGTGNELDNSIDGNDYNNVLNGASGNDWLWGLNGNDTLWGGTGNDFLGGGAGADIMRGGANDDYYTVDNSADQVIESPDEGWDGVDSTATFTLGSNIELLSLVGFAAINGTGNELDNSIFGNDNNNVLNGASGNDRLEGNDGNDTLIGGIGDDEMGGGAGNDIYYVDSVGDFVSDAVWLEDSEGHWIPSYDSGGYDIVYSSVNFSLTGDMARQYIEGLTLTGTAAINGNGNDLNNTLIGNAGNNTLSGESGSDILNGGTGIDNMNGGLGNDTYYVDNAGDITTETSTLATEIDTVVSSVSRTLGANLERLTLSGAAAINAIGNALANILIGNAAANILIGGAGIDNMVGGLGNDTYYVDNAGDITTETSTLATEIDTVVSSVSRTLGANLERLTLTGTAAINGAGNTLANILTGNAGINVLSGGSGNDVLSGGLGNDDLAGGAGLDTFVFDTALNVSINRDAITDFFQADDTIRLDRSIFTKLTTLGTLSSTFFKSSSNGLGDSNDYVLYNTTTGALLYDQDANGAGVAVQFATLTTKPTITAADFMVVA